MSPPVLPLHAALARATHIYKRVGASVIEADVIGACPGASKPCVVWIHGGGLIFGSRKASPRASLLQALIERGFVVVSIDYRLAPETKLADITLDVRDAWRWVHEVGPQRFGIDPTRIAIAGASAGAYLSLIAGCLFEPRPRAVASLWGYGDITAAWEADPSPHYRMMDLVTRDTAVAALSAPQPPGSAAETDRSLFYLYCRQTGQWLHEVTAHDPRDDAAWFDRFSPIRMLTARHSPTVLVHGTDDSDVPHDESARLAARLAELGVERRFISLPGVGHGFAGAAPEDALAAEDSVASFLRAHTQPAER